MKPQLVIFLAFSSATLLFNAIVIWYAYKAFTNVTYKVTDTLRELQASESSKVWLSALEAASIQAVSLTEKAKNRLANFDPVLARAQSKYEFRLAQIDVQMDKGLTKLRDKTESFQGSLERPANKLGATLSGVFEVMRVFSGEQNVDDANPTPKK